MKAKRWRLLGMMGLALGIACSPTPRLEEALVGRWEVWCPTDSRTTTTCAERRDRGFYKQFEPGGRLRTGSTHTHTTIDGSWSLEGSMLELRGKGGGLEIVDRYEARIIDGRLVLWDASSEHGLVLGRAPAAQST